MSSPQPEPSPDEYDSTYDSGFDSDGHTPSTTSLSSIVLQGRYEFGRRYHSYDARHGYYHQPDDEHEQVRLDFQAALIESMFGGKSVHAPVTEPARVLDLGAGTGRWAIKFADDHPRSTVLGIDLSPIQPGWVPPNCSFLLDDFNDDGFWTSLTRSHYIHLQFFSGTIHDPASFYRSLFDNLEEGGYVELVDTGLPTSDDESIPPGSALQQWITLWQTAQLWRGRDPSEPASAKRRLMHAGFEDVQETLYKIPQNDWPKDPKLKEVGKQQFCNIYHGLHALSVKLFVYELGMRVDSAEALLAYVRQDLCNRRIHAYWPLYVVYGHKPRSASRGRSM